jgi:hypothetical protein
MAVTIADKSKPYIPLAGLANDGWSKEEEATATCFCGAVQLAFVSTVPWPAYLSQQDFATGVLLFLLRIPSGSV